MIRHGIIPPYLLRSIAVNGTRRQQALVWATLTDSEQIRGQRLVLPPLTRLAVVPGRLRRSGYDARSRYDLPGKLVRSEGSAASGDPRVNEAYSGAGTTYEMFRKVFDRNSIDDRGMRLDATVHYGQKYDNAFWNGRQMVYGDGDGVIFGPFTRALEVIGHELSHGVVQYEADLVYRGQSGALNESFADVFGILVKQYRRRQTAAESDWLIGRDLFRPGVGARALRSMKEPGTAYDDPVLGRDPQPGHMKGYIVTNEDNGGVHLNSGIPNRAFCELALRLEGYAWEKAGRIWYRTLCDKLRPNSTFRDAASLSVTAAGEIYGRNSPEQKAARESWAAVGL